MNEQSIDPVAPEKAGNRPQRQRYRPTALQRFLVLLAVAVGVVLGAVGWAAATETLPHRSPAPARHHPKPITQVGPTGKDRGLDPGAPDGGMPCSTAAMPCTAR